MIPIAPHITAFFSNACLSNAAPAATRVTPMRMPSSFFLNTQVTVSGCLHRNLDQIDAPLVVDFLNHLETARMNGPSSRNVRLAAIKSFMHFMEYFLGTDPAHGHFKESRHASRQASHYG